jgi:cytidyltransferase-like protein
MFINELAEPTLLVIYPGRFQPFHKGHHAVYQYLTSKFGRNNVYIATSNKVEEQKSPFTFSEKSYFMQLTGVPVDRIIQATQPYSIENVVASGNMQITDPANTVAIFAVSEKDMAEDPRFKSWHKKDGTPAYFQPLTNIKDTKSMSEHGYIMTVPTFDFNVLGQPMRSGTELRQMYVESDERKRQLIIKDLFGKYTAEAEQIMNRKLSPAAPIKAPPPPKLPKTPKPEGGLVKEEAAGVGVVKNGNDPRYVMSTAGDQNAVNGTTPGKNLRAFNLAETEELINTLKAHPAFKDSAKINELQQRINEYQTRTQS